MENLYALGNPGEVFSSIKRHPLSFFLSGLITFVCSGVQRVIRSRVIAEEAANLRVKQTNENPSNRESIKSNSTVGSA